MPAETEDLSLLQALCQTKDVGLLRRACRALETRRWSRAEHAAVFEACVALASLGARIEPASLAARVTRAGFPDVDLDSLFAPFPLAESSLRRHLRDLEGSER